MSVVSDEMLMAYADGVLAPTERVAVEAAIQRYPECREKVEKFRATLSPLQNLFRESIGVDHLEPLIERIRRADLAPGRAFPRPAEVRQLPQARPARSPRHPWHQHYPVAIAASLALLIGAGLGALLQPRATSSATTGFIAVSDGRLTAQGPLQDLLEHTARGIPVRAELAGAGTWELEAAFSFRSIGLQPCRRYELRSTAQEHFAGFACRGGDGQWTVQAHVKLDATPVNPGAGFAPASGPSADAADVALDAAISAAGGGRPYPDAEEKAALVAGWAR